VFGKLFVSNPDLPARFTNGASLTPFETATFYSPGPKGYTDYESLT
jgi:N-ethylmaleimide reductase